MLRSIQNHAKEFLASQSVFKTARTASMALKTLTAQDAAKLDEELMSSGGFSIDQLMELAGLSVAQAAHTLTRQTPSKIQILSGPGNNGGDGLVAARHLHHFGHTVTVHYPKPSLKPGSIYPRLIRQLQELGVELIMPLSTSAPETEYSPIPNLESKDVIDTTLNAPDLIIDSLFGFSFTGEIRSPFPPYISYLAETATPILAVDAPSSWDIDTGPRKEGPGKGYMPSALISLTAPKPLTKFLSSNVRHFVGGRFLSKDVAEKFGLSLPPYEGYEQICEVKVEDQGRL